MDHIRDHVLNIEDSRFYLQVITEMVNTDVRMTPILHEVVKLREETQNLCTSLAALCVPMVRDFRETLEEHNETLTTRFSELGKIEKELNEITETQFKLNN